MSRSAHRPPETEGAPTESPWSDTPRTVEAGPLALRFAAPLWEANFHPDGPTDSLKLHYGAYCLKAFLDTPPATRRARIHILKVCVYFTSSVRLLVSGSTGGDDLYGVGAAGERIAEVIASAEFRIDKMLVY